MLRQRIRYIDYGEAVLVLYVLLYHAASKGLTLYYHQIQSIGGFYTNIRFFFPFLMFSIPWFFYKAGMLFRVRGISELLKYDVRKMLKPLLLWTIVAYIIYLIESIVEGTASLHAMTYSVVRKIFLKGYLDTNVPLWFLLTLFFVRQTGNIFLKHIHPLAIAIFGLLVSYFCYKTNFKLMPLWVANTGSGLFFFNLGYYFSHYKNIINPDRKCIQLIAGIVFVSWCIASYFLPIDSIARVPLASMNSNYLYQGIYLLWFPVCLLGIWAFNGAVKSIDKKLFCFLNWVASHAMSIYVIHGIVYSLCAWVVFSYFETMNPIAFVFLNIVLYGIMMLCIRFADQKHVVKR